MKGGYRKQRLFPKFAKAGTNTILNYTDLTYP